mmetsp:Transcript_60222/g.111648  ORF Transcript_60222/g.111648 Transcript_60222/m.111648 type:complete len:81 (+) Transcript_60222:106-348(+)
MSTGKYQSARAIHASPRVQYLALRTIAAIFRSAWVSAAAVPVPDLKLDGWDCQPTLCAILRCKMLAQVVYQSLSNLQQVL